MLDITDMEPIFYIHREYILYPHLVNRSYIVYEDIISNVKIPMSNQCEAPRAQRGASRKRNFFYIVPLDPAYKAGLAGYLPVK